LDLLSKATKQRTSSLASLYSLPTFYQPAACNGRNQV
jgi:hypothetical protein